VSHQDLGCYTYGENVANGLGLWCQEDSHQWFARLEPGLATTSTRASCSPIVPGRMVFQDRFRPTPSLPTAFQGIGRRHPLFLWLMLMTVSSNRPFCSDYQVRSERAIRRSIAFTRPPCLNLLWIRFLYFLIVSVQQKVSPFGFSKLLSGTRYPFFGYMSR
jgi:hypothetical protein